MAKGVPKKFQADDLVRILQDVLLFENPRIPMVILKQAEIITGPYISVERRSTAGFGDLVVLRTQEQGFVPLPLKDILDKLRRFLIPKLQLPKIPG